MVAEGFYLVSVTAAPEDTPRNGAIVRSHECNSKGDAEDLREVLVDQVRTAVETVGGEIVSVEIR
jgi:hypothetical protein